eukprot:6571452-Prymnesium_polylepis.1
MLASVVHQSPVLFCIVSVNSTNSVQPPTLRVNMARQYSNVWKSRGRGDSAPTSRAAFSRVFRPWPATAYTAVVSRFESSPHMVWRRHGGKKIEPSASRSA